MEESIGSKGVQSPEVASPVLPAQEVQSSLTPEIPIQGVNPIPIEVPGVTNLQSSVEPMPEVSTKSNATIIPRSSVAKLSPDQRVISDETLLHKIGDSFKSLTGKLGKDNVTEPSTDTPSTSS